MTTSDLPRPPVALPAPRLTTEMISTELKRIFAKDRRSNLVAFYGTGEEHTLAASAKTFAVVPTRSELDLRRRLPALLDQNGGGFVYLVDWTEQLPLDISGRLASGRLQRIAKDTRVASLYGAREVDPRLLGTALARVVLTRPEIARRLPPVSGQVLQHHDAYLRLLNAIVGFPLRDAESGATFIRWCIEDKSGAVVHQLAAEEEPLSDELAAVIEESHGPLAAAAWSAWSTGQGEAFWEHAMLLHALLPSWGDGSYAEGVLDDRLSVSNVPFGRALLAARHELKDDDLVDDVLKKLHWRAHELTKVEASFDKPQLLAALGESLFLPQGLIARQERLSNALRECADDPNAERVQIA